MRKPVVFLNPDEKQSMELRSMLKRVEYYRIPMSSLSELAPNLKEGSPCALIADLDHVPLDLQTLRALPKENLESCGIGLSTRSFHPEVKERI